MSANIKVRFLFASLILTKLNSQEVIKRPDGSDGLFITGRGCGSSTAFKYLNYIPEDLKGHECSFIDLEEPFDMPPSKLGKKKSSFAVAIQILELVVD